MRTGPLATSPRTWAVDLAIACFVTAAQVQGTLSREAAEPATVLRPLADLGHLGTLLLVTSGAALVARRRFPVAVFAVTATVSAVYYALDFPDGPGWLALFVSLYGLTAYGDGRRSVVVAGLGTTALAASWLASAADIEPRAALGWVFFRIGGSAMSAALGESVRTRGVIAEEALARAEEAERTREELARSRVDEERLRIAREVHDTVAHAIAVINVQSGVTKHLLDKGSDRTREALGVIEETSSRALHEMRSILGVLHDDQEGPPAGPGLSRVEDIVDAGRDAGLDIELRGATTLSDLPTAVDRAAYRIVQESVTNVIRHAGAVPVRIGIERTGDDLELRVTNDAGRGTPGRPDRRVGAGRGISGMRERCRLLGGELDAGPLPGGGFAVCARLPLTSPYGAPA